MGNCDCSRNDIEKNENKNQDKVTISDFTMLYPIGKGGIARVWKVLFKREYNLKSLDNNILKNESRIFAMKIICKAKIYLKKSVQNAVDNRKFLEMLNYNLLCKMYYAFQDTDNLYIVMDYLSGGNLRYHICKKNFFTEQETKFIAACIVLNLNYLHQKNIIYRNLKPEKLIFDKDGYLHLIDSGISMECKNGETVTSLSGTPGYMAPEAIINKPHDFCVDYYALGVIIYELMLGERPYKGGNRKEIKEQMFSFEIELNDKDLPEGWNDKNVLDLINKLLKRKKKYRLGNQGNNEVKNHLWFKDIQWEQIENLKLNSPFKFDIEDNFNKNVCQQQDDDSIY